MSLYFGVDIAAIANMPTTRYATSIGYSHVQVLQFSQNQYLSSYIVVLEVRTQKAYVCGVCMFFYSHTWCLPTQSMRYRTFSNGKSLRASHVSYMGMFIVRYVERGAKNIDKESVFCMTLRKIYRKMKGKTISMAFWYNIESSGKKIMRLIITVCSFSSYCQL